MERRVNEVLYPLGREVDDGVRKSDHDRTRIEILSTDKTGRCVIGYPFIR